MHDEDNNLLAEKFTKREKSLLHTHTKETKKFTSANTRPHKKYATHT